MSTEFKLGVFRRRDEELQGDYSGESPLAWELHRRRARALHVIFDHDREFQVKAGTGGKEDLEEAWRQADDTERTHEFVELALVAVAVTAVPVVAGAAGLIWLGRRLRRIGVTDEIAAAAQSLVGKVRSIQRSEDVLQANVTHPQFGIYVRPGAGDA